MAIHIHGKQMQLTQALQEYAERKLGPLQQWFESPVDIQVSMAVQGHKHEQRVEVTIPYRGVVFRAEERQPDMYAAVDLVSDKLARKLRKFKEKARRKARYPHNPALLTRPESHEEATAVDEDDEFAVVRIKTVPVKPVDVDEAIWHMNMLDHQFHLFRNKASNELEVVYRRNDGTYGLITT